MIKLLAIPALLMLSACGLGQPSQGITATYDQTSSRAAYDRVMRDDPQCHNHNHFDGCAIKTEVKNHVSPIKGVVASRAAHLNK